MLNNSELEGLLGAMRTSRITTLDVKSKERRLRLVLPLSIPLPASALIPIVDALPEITRISATSPTIGTFLRRGIDDGLPLLEPGVRVMTGEILGYVCQGPVRVIVDAPRSGVLTYAGPQDGAVMGLGDTVFNLDVMP